MMALGLSMAACGVCWFLLGILAEASHPTGGNSLTSEVKRNGAMLGAAGLVVVFLGWLF